ncbi:MAG: biopolymer transporter ExbD [Roseibium sp.]
MIKLTLKRDKKPLETTISLINIVFLMLIFFLVAGQLAPPLDPEVTLAQIEEIDPLPPPDALYVRKDGALVYREQPITAAAYLSEFEGEGDAEKTTIRLAADQGLTTDHLLKHVAALYQAGASRVVLVTQKSSP